MARHARHAREPFEGERSVGGVSGTATPSPARPAPRRERGPAHRWWVLGVIGLAQLMVVLDATIVNIALPSAQHDLGFSDGDRQWVVTAYTLAFGGLLLLGGRIADLVGRKSDLHHRPGRLRGRLRARRRRHRASGCWSSPAPCRACSPPCSRRPRCRCSPRPSPTRRSGRRPSGSSARSPGRAARSGCSLGGVLTEYLDWRWCLYVNVLDRPDRLRRRVGCCATGARAHRPKLDVPGTLLVSAGLFGVVYGFSNAESARLELTATWGCLAAGGRAAGRVRRWWQRRAAHPLLPLRVVAGPQPRRRPSWRSLLAGAGMFGVFLFLTYYLQTTCATRRSRPASRSCR